MNDMELTPDDIKLKPKEERFCQEYFSNGCNGTKAALSVGYAEKSAGVQACRLLKKDKILTRIRTIQKNAREQLGIDDNWAVLRAIEIYNRCTQAVPVKIWSYDEHKMVESGEYTFDSKGAVNALRLIKELLNLGDEEAKKIPAIITFIDDTRGS